MRPIYTRDSLLALVAQHAPSNACARAISEDRATVLGGFSPSKGFPYYLVRVTAKHGQSWLMRVAIDQVMDTYWVREQLIEPDWSEWDGHACHRHDKDHRPLIDGDNPMEYSLYKVVARRKNGS